MSHHVSYLSLFHIEISFSHSSILQIQDRWLASSRVHVSIGIFICIYVYMAVSENRGTPKSSILIECSSINHPFWGTTSFGNTHIYIYTFVYIYTQGLIFLCPNSDFIRESKPNFFAGNGGSWTLDLMNVKMLGATMGTQGGSPSLFVGVQGRCSLVFAILWFWGSDLEPGMMCFSKWASKSQGRLGLFVGLCFCLFFFFYVC